MELNLSRDNACQKTMYQKEYNTTKLFKVGVLIHQKTYFVYMIDNQNTPY